MSTIFSKNTINRLISLLLIVVFLSSFPTGASAKALCLDEEENHIVDQNLILAGCHSSVDTYLPLSAEHCSALAEKENNDCIDVSLTDINTVNLPSKIALPVIAKTVLSCTLPSRLIGFQLQVVGQSSTALFQYQTIFSHLNAHRTIILLI